MTEELPSAYAMEQKLIISHIQDAMKNGLDKIQYTVYLCDSTVQWLETHGYTVKRLRNVNKPEMTTISWLSNNHLVK